MDPGRVPPTPERSPLSRSWTDLLAGGCPVKPSCTMWGLIRDPPNIWRLILDDADADADADDDDDGDNDDDDGDDDDGDDDDAADDDNAAADDDDAGDDADENDADAPAAADDDVLCYMHIVYIKWPYVILMFSISNSNGHKHP